MRIGGGGAGAPGLASRWRRWRCERRTTGRSTTDDCLDTLGGSGKLLNEISLRKEVESATVMAAEFGIRGISGSGSFGAGVNVSGENKRRASILLSSSLCLRSRSSKDVTLVLSGVGPEGGRGARVSTIPSRPYTGEPWDSGRAGVGGSGGDVRMDLIEP
jgi:hypothetical protein